MNSFSRIVVLSLMSLTASIAQPVKTLRWAVIGGSVANAGYPGRMSFRLPADSVISYAFSGGTVLKSGDSSYWTSGKLAQVMAYQPDIVSIQLGANDSKSVNWGDSANFERDYKALIDTLSALPTKPRILLVYPTPVFKNEAAPQSPNLLRGSVIGKSIIPLVRKIARDRGTDTVDLYSPFLNQQTLFTDSINPTTAANDTLGRRLFEGYVAQSIRIMCVGNSITYANGTTTGVTTKDAYPLRLNMLLGPRYWVWNGGKSGWWMQRRQLPGASSAYKSYVTDKNQMDTLFLRKPHYITVKLGTNDARQNFWNTAGFITDYQYFIDTLYNNMTPKPKFVLFKAFPAWQLNGNWQFANSGYTAAANGINGDIIRDSLKPAIDAIAASRPAQVAGVVDLYTPFISPMPTLAPDGVHPNKTGQDSIAHIVYRAFLTYPTAVAQAKVRPKAENHRNLRYLKPDRQALEGAGRVNSLDGRKVRGDLPGATGVYVMEPVRKKTKVDEVGK